VEPKNPRRVVCSCRFMMLPSKEVVATMGTCTVFAGSPAAASGRADDAGPHGGDLPAAILLEQSI
jgi:hypothetical protein